MFEYFITHYGTQLLTAILCALFGSLAYAAKQLATKYVNDDTKRSIAREAMLFVEQVWEDHSRRGQAVQGAGSR